MSQTGVLQEISEALAGFADVRDWNQFHTPKNLSMALAVEVAEIMEILQWVPGEKSRNLDEEQLQALSEELADAFVYLIRLADMLDVDLIRAARDKIEKNGKKYPVEQARGSSAKYTAYEKG